MSGISVKNLSDGVKTPGTFSKHKEMKIQVSHGLMATNKSFTEVDASEIETYLQEHTDCYERTSDKLNRVYIDIDGEIESGMMDESEFTELQDQLCFILSNLDDYSVKTSSQFKANKLSFTLIHKTKCGSRQAVRSYVENEAIPNVLKPELEGIIPFYTNPAEKKDLKGKTSIGYDSSVYDKGRKMRMLYSSKPNEVRPYTLVSGTALDTLITYIPNTHETLPEPIQTVELKATPKVQPVVDIEPIQTADDNVELLTKVLEALPVHLYDDYAEWVQIGMVCFNSNIPLSVWDKVSQKSSKWAPNVCSKKWATFKRGGLTEATLWLKLKQTNMEAFKELSLNRTDFECLVRNNSHAESANYFFSIKPDHYMHDAITGWYNILPSNIWANTGKTCASSLINDIFRTFNLECIEYEKVLLKKQSKVLSDSSSSTTEKIEKLEENKKRVSEFKKQVGTKSFCEGVTAYLKGLYEERTNAMVAERQVSSITNIMDENRDLFAFTDAVYDLQKREYRSIRPTDYITITCGYKRPLENKNIQSQIWDALFSIWEDAPTTDYVLKTIASCVCGTRNMEEWYIWTGRGGNGKGMLMELTKMVFGNYYYDLPNEILTKRQDKPNAPSPDLYNCRGRRLLNTTEPEGNDRILEGTTKLLTGGDSLTVRGLHRDPITYKPQFGLFLQANNVPTLNTLTGGSVRRIRIIPFPFQFVASPKDIMERQGNAELKNKYCRSPEWRDQFILMLFAHFESIRGAKEISMPAMVTERTTDYIDECDVVGRWLTEYYIPDDSRDANGNIINKIPARELYNQFKVDTGSGMNEKAFKAGMEFKNYSAKKNSIMVYVGIRRREE